MAYVPQEFADHPAAPPGARSSRRLALAAPAGVAEIMAPVAELQPGPVVRRRPLDEAHVAALAEVPSRWPPILVCAGTMAVVDGMHRVAAARQLGLSSVRAHIFEGSDLEALVEAVRSNVTHGLPLRLKERTSATRRILAGSPERSDRAIAEICGLDHKTVARMRAAQRTGEDGDVPAARIGRDNRARPVNAAELRARIAAALAESPDDSLRKIAARVGAAPETVRAVKARQARGEDPLAANATPHVDLPAQTDWPASTTPPPWVRDTACRARPEAAEFAAWFDPAASALQWQRYVHAVPLSRAYEISDQARAYARAWQAFAEALEARTRRPGAGA